MVMIEMSNFKHVWTHAEKVVVKSITPLGGWGVGSAMVVNLFDFYFVEREGWFKAATYTLDDFMDEAAIVPVYFFKVWDDAVLFAKTKSNRYTIGSMLWWLRFQDEFWFSTIFTEMMDTINYLNSNERYMDLRGKLVNYADRRFYKKPS